VPTEAEARPKAEGRPEAETPKRVFVVARRRKGRPIRDVVHEVERLLAGAGVTSETEVVKKKRAVRDATTRAMKDGVDLVLAIGGDGTVLQVATSLSGSQVPLGIVPTGTGNLLASNLDISKEPAEAVRIALEGRPRRIDVGSVKVGGKRRDFTVACGIGFDADVMDRTDSEQKGRWGKMAYLANAIRESGNITNVVHEVTLDGVRSTTEAAQVLIANLGRVPLGLQARGVRPDDGLLDVFIVRASGPLPALLAGWQALRQSEQGEGGGGRVFRAKARKVRIETRPPRKVETDGSVVGCTPVTATIRPAALTVMVPRRSSEGRSPS
jgi:YegS/Rv2252/BmrU family lipid kinase